MREPEIVFGKGRNQIILRGEEAIRAAGWTVPFSIVMRNVAIVLTLLGVLFAGLKLSEITRLDQSPLKDIKITGEHGRVGEP